MKKQKRKQSLTYVILSSLFIVILILQAGSGVIGYYEFRRTLTAQYERTSEMIAEAASNIVTVDRLDSYLQSKEPDQTYSVAQKRLQNLVDSSGCMVIYVAKLDEEAKKRTYVYNVVGADFGFSAYEIGFTDDAGDLLMEGYTRMKNGDIKSYTYVRSNSNGHYATTFVPLYDNHDQLSAICSVVMPMTALTTARRFYLQQLLIWSVAISLLAGAGWFYMMRRRVVVPLRKIADEANRFSIERTIAEKPLGETVNSGSEIGELAYAFDQMEETLVKNVTELLYMTAERNRIGAELNVATKIQSNILPAISESFPGRKEMEVSAYMKPAREVGGDFYDFFFIDEDHFALVIADVSGKGIPAALFMMISKVLIKTTCMGENKDPGEVLALVNQKLCENNEVDMFVTVWLGILELSTGKMVCSNAGHEYPAVGGSTGRIELYKDKHGFVLGGMPGIKEKSYELQLGKGDTLFVYTDGVAEALNHQQEQFGTDRLLEALNRDTGADPKNVISYVNEALNEFVGEEEQFDDTTMLCIKYQGL